MIGLKIGFAVCLLIVFLAGLYTFKNFERWFGQDLNVPSETESSRLLNKSQIILVWLLAMKLLVMMVWIL